MNWGPVFFLSVVAAMGVISSTLCAPALPFIADHFLAHIATVQFTISLFLVGNAFGQFASGPLSDRFGQKKVLLSALTLYILASLTAAIAGSMGVLIVARFFQGMGSSVGPVLARAIATRQYPTALSARIQSYGAIGVGFASILAILCAGQVTLISWRGNFYLAASLGLLLWIWAASILKEEKVSSKRSFRDLMIGLKQVILDIRFVRPAFAHAMTYGLMYGYIGLFPFFLIALFHEKNPMQVALYSALMIGCYMAGAFAAARLVMKIAIEKLIVSGLLLQLVSGIFLLFAPKAFGFFTALFLFNVGIGLILPLTASSALSPFASSLVGSASSALGLSYRFVGSLISTGICALPLAGGMGLGGALVVLSVLSLVFYLKLGNRVEDRKEEKSHAH